MRKTEDYIKQINDLPESEWERMKEHMDKKFPNMKMPNMDTFKEMVKPLTLVQNNGILF